MKGNLIMLAASLILLCGTASASATPAAETSSTVCAASFEQEVTVYYAQGGKVGGTYIVTASDNACNSYTIHFQYKRSYRVLESDKEGYRYMFYDYSGSAYYFNM